MSEAVERSASNTARRWLGWLVKVAVSALVICWLLRQKEPREALLRVSAAKIAIGVLCYAACQMLNAYKWGLISAAMGYPQPFRELARLYFIGMFANFFLPTSVGGDLLKIGLMTPLGVPASVGALSVFMGRFTGLLAMLVVGAAGGVAAGGLAAGAMGTQARHLLVVALGLSVLVVVVGVVAVLGESRWKLADRLPKPLAGPWRRIAAGLAGFGSQRKLLGIVLLMSLVFQLLMVALNAYLGYAVHVTPGWVHWFWLVPVFELGGMIPAGFGGIGPREVAAQKALEALGLDAGGACSLLWQAVKILTSLPGGFLLAGIRRREAKSAAEETR